ncbi:17013_t:CDS:2 [Cetraspora pellucida]|uniref:17013_t:CDS:1 n=1 Tax=Cetraspora pellucida TaxID=1433469 RepID=A0ACA9L608_9GLOM|nr:17013_t:CDS:2 [Cetraspora pellucida]
MTEMNTDMSFELIENEIATNMSFELTEREAVDNMSFELPLSEISNTLSFEFTQSETQTTYPIAKNLESARERKNWLEREAYARHKSALNNQQILQ